VQHSIRQWSNISTPDIFYDSSRISNFLNILSQLFTGDLEKWHENFLEWKRKNISKGKNVQITN